MNWKNRSLIILRIDIPYKVIGTYKTQSPNKVWEGKEKGRIVANIRCIVVVSRLCRTFEPVEPCTPGVYSGADLNRVELECELVRGMAPTAFPTCTDKSLVPRQASHERTNNETMGEIKHSDITLFISYNCWRACPRERDWCRLVDLKRSWPLVSAILYQPVSIKYQFDNLSVSSYHKHITYC